MGRPPIRAQAMTNAEHQARYRAKHGRAPDPTGAARQKRLRDRRAGMPTAQRAALEVTPEAPDLLLAQAEAIAENRGEGDLIPTLRANWPYIHTQARELMAAGKVGFRRWLRDG
jgi:hypothetical protein